MKYTLAALVAILAFQAGCSGENGGPGVPGPSGPAGAAGPAGPAAEPLDGGKAAETGVAAGRGNIDHLELPTTGFYPESITASADGSLFVSGVGLGAVAKFAPNSIAPTFFLPPGGEVKNITGVLVDDDAGLLYLCAVNFSTNPPSTLGVRSYKLSDGSFQANYPLPGPGFCNDLALDGAKNLYIADSFGKILKLAKGAPSITVWSSEALLSPSSPGGFGADGIVVDGSSVYVNAFSDNRLLRIAVKDDGSAGAVTSITVTPALKSPDGMRLISPGVLAVVEGEGRLSKVTVTGTTATSTPIANRLDAPTGVVKSGDSWWVTEGQLGYLLGAPGTPKLPFYVRRVTFQP